MAGIVVTKAEVDTAAGSIARDLQLNMRRVIEFKRWLDAKSDQDLTALGFGAAEIADIRSAFADAAELADICYGNATLGANKDFRTFLRRLSGLFGV
jgi:hypothetical protein